MDAMIEVYFPALVLLYGQPPKTDVPGFGQVSDAFAEVWRLVSGVDYRPSVYMDYVHIRRIAMLYSEWYQSNQGRTDNGRAA